MITDVTDLVGKDVYVEADSKYEARIRNLNQEVGGGINIHTVDHDTMITEDLIAMVNEGKIPWPEASKAWLGDSIDAWLNSDKPRQEQAMLLKRYFELSKNDPDSRRFNLNGATVTPFDHLFKQYSETYGWDWKLLASQA